MTSINILTKKIDYTFDDEQLLQQALRHRSAGQNHNERLEFLGDAILNFIIADILFEYFPQAREGKLSRLRAVLVNKATLSAIARELKLNDYVSLGRGEYKSGGANRDSILADSLEALIGAIYLDSDIKTCRKCLLNFYQSRLETLSLNKTHKDAKTRLQEHLQQLQQPLPHYELKAMIGKSHLQEFIILCTCTLFTAGVEGQGKTRRQAEQNSAQKMLEVLQDV